MLEEITFGPCKKCGSVSGTIKYQKTGPSEYLRHTCDRCDYSWFTTTLDRKEDP